MVEILLQNSSVDFNACDPVSGVNSIWLACLYGHGKIMNLLVKKGGDIYSKNRFNVNVLHLAVLKNHIDIARSLIYSGFSLDQVTNNGMSALHLICLLDR